jgi:glycerol-3-phosphate dehydrogenase subunit C
MLSGLTNAVLSDHSVNWIVKRIAGIHPERELPRIPGKNFFTWAKDRGLCNTSTTGHGVAYFVGCTAGYLFPEVGRAAVTVLLKNDVKVNVPSQQCCGMPTLVEGDVATTLKRAKSNLESLLAAKDRNLQPVSSCPTCGFMMKVLLKEGAYHSEDYQQWIGADDDELKIPDDWGNAQFTLLKKSLYGNILKDDGLLSALPPLDRIGVSDSLGDIGEYLDRLLDENKFDDRFRNLPKRIVYFAPFHQREQMIGSPYARLLSLIPGLDIEQVGGAMDCCGMGGSLGYKKGFHDASISLGAPVADKVSALKPDILVTDCLSCRLQFQQLLPFPVCHPIEILSDAYR